ncbi:MAG: calcium-binding protein [Pirellulales bacterium]
MTLNGFNSVYNEFANSIDRYDGAGAALQGNGGGNDYSGFTSIVDAPDGRCGPNDDDVTTSYHNIDEVAYDNGADDDHVTLVFTPDQLGALHHRGYPDGPAVLGESERLDPEPDARRRQGEFLGDQLRVGVAGGIRRRRHHRHHGLLHCNRERRPDRGRHVRRRLDQGTPLVDLIFGQDGNDTIDGLAAGDCIFGGRDHDSIVGGSGADIILGGSGNDTIRGGIDADQIVGGSGDDELYGDQANDTIRGGRGNDQIFGGADEDWLYGGGGDDSLSGELGHDRLWGESGADSLSGQADNDTLDGGAGIDSVNGDDGVDKLQVFGTEAEFDVLRRQPV